MVQVEEEAWKDPAHRATASMFASRISTYRAGVFVAEFDGRIVGHAALQKVDPDHFDQGFTWERLTDSGFIARSHNPLGQALYGVNLSVSPKAPPGTIGFLMSRAKLLCITIGALGIYVSPRIPSLRRFLEKQPGGIEGGRDDLIRAANDYVSMTHKGELRDPELRMYARGGAQIVRVLPDFFPDNDSLNFGALAYWENRIQGPFLLGEEDEGYLIFEPQGV